MICLWNYCACYQIYKTEFHLLGKRNLLADCWDSSVGRGTTKMVLEDSSMGRGATKMVLEDSSDLDSILKKRIICPYIFLLQKMVCKERIQACWHIAYFSTGVIISCLHFLIHFLYVMRKIRGDKVQLLLIALSWACHFWCFDLMQPFLEFPILHPELLDLLPRKEVRFDIQAQNPFIYRSKSWYFWVQGFPCSKEMQDVSLKSRKAPTRKHYSLK